MEARFGAVPVGLSFLSSHCSCDDPCRPKNVDRPSCLGGKQLNLLRHWNSYVPIRIHPRERVLHLYLRSQPEVVAKEGGTVAPRRGRHARVSRAEWLS